jgi:type IX secretion system PorP/SprF family membrane protein
VLYSEFIKDNMFKKIVFALVILQAHRAFCQELTIFGNYNTSHQLLINPAFSGIYSTDIISIGFRKQWVGFTNSPLNQSITGSFRTGTFDFYNPKQYLNKTKFTFSDRIGLGFALNNSIKGPLNESSGILSYAYHLPVSSGTLAMGISGLVSGNFYNYRNSHATDAGDPALQSGKEYKVSVDANFGVLYYTKNWCVGISVMELFASEYYLKSTDKNRQDYYMILGYNYNINKKLRFEPMLVCKKINSEKINVDVHANINYDKILSAGVSWYSRQYIEYKIKLHVYKYLYAGYAFQQQINDFAGFSIGSHQINLYFIMNYNH